MKRTIRRSCKRFPGAVRAALLALVGLATLVAAPARSDEDDGGAARALPRAAATAGLPDGARQRPLAFEANRGQTDPQVRFLARGAGYTVFLTASDAVLSLGRPGSEHAVVRVQPVGASPKARLLADDPLPGVVHYAHVPADEPIDAPTWARVRYDDVYPGVDLVYYGRPGQLEYDFVVAPGADPGAIALALDGAERPVLDGDGTLLVRTAAGVLRQPRPVAYQEVGGGRRAVSADYAVDESGRVRLRLGAYDRSRELVIDPVLVYSTYLGGSNEESDWIYGAVFGIAVDTAGNTYVTGTTTSVDFPTTPGAAKRTLDGAQDGFVTKLSPTGAVLYSTYLGGPCDDIADAIAVDGAGNAYVTGRAHGGVCWAEVNPGVLVAKLSPTGALAYALVFGGAYADTSRGTAIAVDAQGRAYVTGMATVTDFPTTQGAFRRVGCSDLGLPGYGDGFVAKVSAAGALQYSTFLCGNGVDSPSGIALDGAGNLVVAGTTRSGDFPTLHPIQPTHGSYPFGTTGFVSKLSADGTQLIYSTYLGGSINDVLNGLALDGQGNAYVVGETESGDFPTTPGVLQPQRGNLVCLDEFCTDAFVAKINAAGNALVYSTYLYGEGDDSAADVAVDANGDAYLIGSTASLFFPVKDAFRPTPRVLGPSDAFVLELNAKATRVLYSSYFGGSGGDSTLTGDDEGSAIAIDAAGNAYVAGSTKSFDFPTTPGAFQPAIGGGVCDYFGGPCGDAFVAKISAGGPGAASPVRVAVNNADLTPGSTVNATWAIPNPTAQDYLILYALGAGSETYVAWWTTGGAAAGTLALTIPAGLPFGNYELRLLTPDPNYGGLLEAVARSQPIHVGTGGACGFGAELAFVMPLLSALHRRARRRC